MMNEIWRTRGEWNRLGVVGSVVEVFREVLDDMMDCQSFGPGSMELGLRG